MFVIRALSQGGGNLTSGLGLVATKMGEELLSGRDITVKSSCFLQRNLISPSYSALGGYTPHTAARKIEAAKTGIAFPSVKERVMAFQAAAQQCLNSQVKTLNTALKEPSVVE
ncbi:hypothetical protein MM368_004811 [Escherichia coli]|uniref:hypothetical protein n=1 Tax=Escherichia coli TaxID=562 RepID=UPI00112FD16B|nr:hypothetical protein [Escherichia coli]EFH0086865.1 hypothetical protein [Escherichia coli]EFK6387948.1 hypothetical protein [Escherichia coli]EFK6418815.1 hypothetical protein [Escherichia coli]EFL6373028.1 hypothetical protein [Escherichia coli]EHQ9373954.1 hypothetical protein [Escherichia coli]